MICKILPKLHIIIQHVLRLPKEHAAQLKTWTRSSKSKNAINIELKRPLNQSTFPLNAKVRYPNCYACPVMGIGYIQFNLGIRII